MALIKSLTVNDVVYPDAYRKITTIRCDKNDAYVYVCSYADENARAMGDFPVFAEEHIASLSELSGDLFTKSYEYLKTLPLYEGATDHFDAIPVIEEVQAEGFVSPNPIITPLPPIDPSFDA